MVRLVEKVLVVSEGSAAEENDARELVGGRYLFFISSYFQIDITWISSIDLSVSFSIQFMKLDVAMRISSNR